MKFNKKIIVASLSTVLGLGLIGSISGTFAWYQYSTRVTASLIGMNAAETGLLEISKDGTNWQRDLRSSDLLFKGGRTNTTLHPMTFAGRDNMIATSALPEINVENDFYLAEDTSKYYQWNGSSWGSPLDSIPGTGANRGTVSTSSALPAQGLAAYKNPDVSNKVVKSDGTDYATRGKYATAWDVATAENDYIQFDLYIRARTVSETGFTQTEEDVYVTDFVLGNIGDGVIAAGLRIHMAVDADGDGTVDNNYLFSKTAQAGLHLYGYLDQDDDGIADRVGGYEWATHRDDHIVYGEGTYTQTTEALSARVANRDAGNNYAIAAGDAAKKLFTTDDTNASKITFTIWVEGWDTTVGNKENVKTFVYNPSSPTVGEALPADTYAQYKLNNVNVDNNYYLASGTALAGVNYFTRTPTNNTVADWSGTNTDGASFQFGLTFDVGRGAFAD